MSTQSNVFLTVSLYSPACIARTTRISTLKPADMSLTHCCTIIEAPQHHNILPAVFSKAEVLIEVMHDLIQWLLFLKALFNNFSL